ncbi:hypothetical protein FOS14_12840 [Skermania sp. ID1734]|uniref:hypothetical protein n=1 Tax=Skermania sp. ID1734 TaxID=2597516 RepID=UPI001181268F|nr:hypothetical protein [Skermania sp. ID1734]TSD99239.1 hypothetical protein FOS14_12840 [Skermania sp. ID1734]
MNVMIEMTALSVGRPHNGASTEAVAAWYEAKSRLHEHLASLGGPDADRERALAVSAHERSLRMLRTVAA